MKGGRVLGAGGDPGECLAGGGAMGALMRATDWERTPLGPVAGWPQSLRTAVSICLGTSFPMMIAWGRDLTMLYNDGYLPVLGSRKHPGALGRPLLECFEEIRELIGPMFHQVLASGTQVGAEDMMFPIERHGYAEETYFVFSYSPIRDESGRVAGVLTTCSETTRRVIGERRLRALRALAEAAGHATTAVDALERAARTLDPPDTPFALLYLVEPGGDRARLVASTGLADGHPARVPDIELAAGDPRWPLADAPRVVRLDDRFGPLPGGPWPEPAREAVILSIARPGQPHPFGFLVAGVSPRRALDDEYRGYLDLVAEHVATAVANARAREEERRRVEALAELDRAKIAFFSNISHEFRTPLTLLIGPLEDLLAERCGPLRPAVRVQIGLTHRNALRLLKLVNTLLDFARLEAGRLRALYEPVDLAALTAQIAGSFRSAIERTGLAFTVDCEPIEEPVHVDVEMWENIVLNLLSNALKFTFEGSIAIRLRARGREVELEVEDTGTGIPAAELPYLFERFHRIQGSRSRSHEGSGIGLALVRDLVRLHGGTITCESEVDRGTRFRATIRTGTDHLPADQVTSARSAEPRRTARADAFLHEALRWLPEPPAAAADPVPAGARVLVADDNADMRDYLASILGARWQVSAVGNGAEALAEIAAHPPDLVLTDVMMPLLDGFGLLRALRADPRTAHIPVVMLSARAGEEARVEGLDAGADDYLVKPFGARELIARVGSQLALARARESLEKQRTTLYSLFKRLPAAVSIVRGEALIHEMVNDRFVECAGGSEADLIGRPARDLVPPLAGAGFADRVREVMRSGEPFVAREQPFHVERDGVAQLSWWNVVLVPLPDEDGRGRRVMSFGDDVSQEVLARRQLEEALAARDETLALLDATLDHAPVGLAFFDRELRYRRINPALEEANGLAAAATLGRRVDEVLPESAGRVARDAILRAFETGEVVGPFEVASPPPGGPQTARHWLRTYYPVRDRTGAISHVGAVVVDVTAQVSARETLAQTVRYNEMFAGTLAHDLRNPLSAIVSAAHLLTLRGDDPKITVPAGRIISSSGRMARMIDQLLDFTRIRLGGGLGLDPRPIDLAEVTRRVVEEVDAEQRRFDISVRGHALGTWDPDRLGQVISNLASNALQHGTSGGDLRIRLDGDRPGELVVAFENAGVIPPELLPVLFDPFRGSGNRSRNASGLGLGLFISREIVTAHGGTIDVASSATDGTRFTVVLPRAPQ